jgi:hypothetical protein
LQIERDHIAHVATAFAALQFRQPRPNIVFLFVDKMSVVCGKAPV